MADSQGITFFDPAGNYVTLEYSTEVPPTPGATWTEVSEVKSIGRNPEASPEIEFTHYASTEQDLRLGLPRRGTWDATANFVPVSTSQEAVMGLDETKEARWWRIVYPKAVTTSTVQATEMWAGYVQSTAIAPPSATDNNPADFNFTIRSRGSYTYTKES